MDVHGTRLARTPMAQETLSPKVGVNSLEEASEARRSDLGATKG